jgi:hypothetical protein
MKSAVLFQVMKKPLLLTVCIVLMIAVIVGLDVLFFKNHFWERLIANGGIVLVFSAFCLRFLN